MARSYQPESPFLKSTLLAPELRKFLDLPPPPTSSSSIKTAVGVEFSDHPVDELALSIEVSGTAILLKPSSVEVGESNKHLEVSC